MRHRRWGNERGASLVEAALALPVVLLVLFGVLDGARYIGARNTVNTVSHEAARYGSSVGLGPSGNYRFVECDAIRAAGVDVAGSPANLTATDIAVEYDKGPGTAVFATCPIGGPAPLSSSVRTGDRVIVTVTQDFTPVSPLVGQLLGTFEITSVSHRSVLSP